MTIQFPAPLPDCRQMEALLPPFVDGEMTPPLRTAVETHLAACPTCRAAADAQRAVRLLLVSRRSSLGEPAPAPLADAVRRAAVPAPGVRWSALAAAASLVFAVGGGAVWATGQSSVLLAAQLTLDHLKCFVIDGDDTPHGLTAAEGQARFHDQFGMEVALPEAPAGGAAKLVSVRQCLYGEGWVAHALYRLDGEAVSLFVLDDPHAAASVDAFGRRTEVVRHAGHTYVVVAPARLGAVAATLGLEAE